MTTYGYARVSTGAQSLDSQVDDLARAGVPDGNIRTETASGTRADRPVLRGLLGELGEGDVLVVSRLDRLGRSLADLVAMVDDLGRRGVGLVAVHDSIDTSTASGRLVLGVMASLAEYEAALTRERVAEGIAASKARGTRFGRPPTDPERVAHALRLYEVEGLSAPEVRRMTGVAESTLYKYLKESRAAAAEKAQNTEKAAKRLSE